MTTTEASEIIAAAHAEIVRLRAALQKLDEMIVQWAKDEGFDPESSSCLRVVRAALKPTS